MEFKELSLIAPLLKAVEKAGYKSPSPIQQKAIPPVLAGNDLLGCAQTGTGKTAAFALPVLQRLATQDPTKKRVIRALVLTPTRELALQIDENFEMYSKYLPLRHTVIFGGVNQKPQVVALKKGVDILVATPGRLHDLISQKYIDLSFVEVFVLDEADRMLDMGFIHDVKKVLRLLPEKRQTLLFSATMPKEIVHLANGMLQNPVKVFVAPQSTTVESIRQTVYKVDKPNKRRLLPHLMQEHNIQNALVFTRTKHGADRVARELSRAGIKAAAIHGDKSQNARQSALLKFKKRQIQVLVATDIAARGLDISELSHVFNYDLPNIPETYVHRIGRTGRAGRGGAAISFCNFDELEYLQDIEKTIGMSIPVQEGHPWPMEIFQKREAVKPGAAPPKNSNGQKNAGTSPKAGKKAPALKSEKNVPAPQPAKQTKKPVSPFKKKGADTPLQDKKAPLPRQDKPKKTAQQPGAVKKGKRREPLPRPPFNPYENLTGPKTIITKRPVWGDSSAEEKPAPAKEGEQDMARNTRKPRGGKKRPSPEVQAKQPKPPVKPKKERQPAPIPKNEHGVFDFSEAELAEDKGLKVISRSNSETKYASFEDFLKDH